MDQQKSNPQWTPAYAPQDKVRKILARNSILQDNNDGLLISEALYLSSKCIGNDSTFQFITADACQYLLAKNFDQLNATYYKETAHKENLWKGYQTFFLTDKELANYYEHAETNTLGLVNNEYAVLHHNNEVIDLVKWNGEINEVVKYKEQNSEYFGKIRPRNDQQKLFFDLLQNRTIPIKLARGQYGSGKTYLALVHALNYIKQHRFDKIVFIRNNIEVFGSQKLGALPGEQEDKLMPFLMPLVDHLGDEGILRQYISEGIIEPVHLGYLRGRNFNNSIILVDEAENLTTDNVKLIVGRAGENSELWFLGDESQTDSDIFRKNSGIASLINSLKGNKLFGTVELQKSERSEVAQCAAIIK